MTSQVKNISADIDTKAFFTSKPSETEYYSVY